MRQSGIIAAAALYALEHNVERLAEDHANAKRLAEGICSLPHIALDPDSVHTNIVIFDVAPAGMPASALANRMAEHGVDFFPITPMSCRLVTHLNVSVEDIELAIGHFQEVLTNV